MGARDGPPQSSGALALMHLTCGHYGRSWGYHTPAMWRTWTSEQPPDAVLFTTWSLTSVCGSSDILPTAHHMGTTTVLYAVIRALSPDWKRPLGRPSHISGFLQWRQTLANRTTLHLHGGRQLFVTTGGALWTQQRPSGVWYERRRRLSIGNSVEEKLVNIQSMRTKTDSEYISYVRVDRKGDEFIGNKLTLTYRNSTLYITTDCSCFSTVRPLSVFTASVSWCWSREKEGRAVEVVSGI